VGHPAPVLTVESLTVSFPAARGQRVTVLDGVSFDVGERETVGLVGESGCGKTTLARAVLRLVHSDAGSVRFRGEEITRLSARAMRSMRRHMQMVFQDPRGSLDPRMRIRAIVEEPLRVHRIGSRHERPRLAREMLAQVGLDASYEQQRPAQLSGGQQQRVGIARALVTRPALVVCDEPVSSLDVSIQAQVLNLLRDLKDDLGVAYLFISHNLAVVRALSDRVAVMYLGQIVEIGPAQRLFEHPRHPYTRGLIASALRPDASARAQLAAANRLAPGDIPSLADPPSGCRYHTRCPFAEERCRSERPTLDHTDASGHLVACHFWREIEARRDQV